MGLHLQRRCFQIRPRLREPGVGAWKLPSEGPSSTSLRRPEQAGKGQMACVQSPAPHALTLPQASASISEDRKGEECPPALLCPRPSSFPTHQRTPCMSASVILLPKPSGLPAAPGCPSSHALSQTPRASWSPTSFASRISHRQDPKQHSRTPQAVSDFSP